MIDPCNEVACETCQDAGTVTVTVYDGLYGQEVANVDCPACDGQVPGFLPGIDDVLEGTREGWDR